MAVNNYDGSKPTDFGFSKYTVTKQLVKEYPRISLRKESGVFSDNEKITIEFTSRSDSPRLYSGVSDKFYNETLPESKYGQAGSYIKNRLYGNDFRYRKSDLNKSNVYNVNFDSERLGNFTILVKDFDQYVNTETISKNIMIDEKSINRIICNSFNGNDFGNLDEVKKYYYEEAKKAAYDDALFDYEAHMYLYTKYKSYCKKSYIRKIDLVKELQIKSVNNEILYNAIKDYYSERQVNGDFLDWLEEQRLKDFQVKLFESEDDYVQPVYSGGYYINSNCTNCGVCMTVGCPTHAIVERIVMPAKVICRTCGRIDDGSVVNPDNGKWTCSACATVNVIPLYSISENDCISCGACVSNCPAGAIVKE